MSALLQGKRRYFRVLKILIVLRTEFNEVYKCTRHESDAGDSSSLLNGIDVINWRLRLSMTIHFPFKTRDAVRTAVETLLPFFRANLLQGP